MSSLLAEVRYTVRSLSQSPVFSLIAVLTLAMGIGGTTAIYSVVSNVLLAPLPYDDPDELIVVGGQLPGLGTQDLTASSPEYRDYVEQSNSLDALAASWIIDINITGIDQPYRGRDAVVTANFMTMLGAEPMLGRGFRPEDAGGDIGHVAILSHDAWQRLYGGDPDVIGRTMLIDDDPIEIIGVMPADFAHPGDTPDDPVDTWAPVDLGSDSRFGQGRSVRRYTLYGRLKDGISPREAQAEFLVIAENLRREYPAAYPIEAGWTTTVVPLIDRVVGNARSSLFLIFGSAAFVLLIACTNVANLLLARGSTRAKETAVRAALGGDRAVIGRSFLLESVVIGLAGGLLGVAIAVLGTDLIRESASVYLPRLDNARVDADVLLFTTAVSLGTSLLFGLIPAVRLSRTNLQQLLRESSGGMLSGNRRLQTALVVAEIAISITLLVGSGLTLKSYGRLMDVDLGFEPESVMTMRTFLPWTIVPQDGRYFEQATRIQFYDEGLRLIEELPEVETAGLVSRLPLRRLNGTSFSLEGSDLETTNLATNAETRQVSPSYFQTLGVSLVQGRTFVAADDVESPGVAVVNQAWVQRYSPEENAIGRRVRLGSNPQAAWLEIVGVVGNVRQHGLDLRPRETIYTSYRQGIFIDMTWVLKTTGEPASVAAPVVSAIRSLDSTLPVFAQTTMDDVVAATVSQRRLVMVLLSLFAAQAIILAAIGIYGVMSQMVNQRTREIGIRMAMGAERSSVMGLVLGDGLRLGGVGILIGAGAAAAGSGVIRSMLYSVNALDPWVYAVVASVALAVVAAATVVPASRAMRVDPILTMKAE